jgi:predicted GNAT superfamily acetyltransferase
MKTIHIRNAGRDDLENLLALNQSNLPHVGSISMPDLEHLHSQAVYFPIAEFERQITGFLIAFEPEAEYGSLNFLWFKRHYKAFVYIDRIVVAPEARRQGVAVRLYRALEHFAADRNIPIMACEYNLRPKNEVSRQFHRRYGFNEVGTQETENGKKTVSLQIKHVDPVPGSSNDRVKE